MSTYKITLINPKRHFRYNWDLQEMCRLMGKKNISTALALPLIAAITPKDFSVQIIDEEIDDLPETLDADLVGISALVSNIKRGYEIADQVKGMGIPVIMGGPQVSFEIDEALKHADSIVIGEVESIWDTILDDFKKHTLKKTYQASEWIDFKESPIPRWDLLPIDKIMSFNVQVSRGCPFKCTFCLVRNIFGEKHRYRDLDNVMEEINSLPPHCAITFADDNLTANKEYAKKLMRRLIPLKVSWNCQTSIETAYDTELLELMAKAGCNSMLIGFETLNPENLKTANKGQNTVERYEEAITNIHNAGIHILASFVVGFDNDTLATFDHIYQFVQKYNISFVMLNALSAYPGSDFYEEMKKQGKLMSVEPDFFNGMYPTMKYEHIGQEDMYLYIQSTLERMFSSENLIKRGTELLGNGSFKQSRLIVLDGKAKRRTLGHIIKNFALSKNKADRMFFLKMFQLVITGKASITAVIEYILLCSSIQDFLRYNRTMDDKIIESIRSRETIEQ